MAELPYDLVRKIYGVANRNTQMKMKGMARWTHSGADAFPVPPRSYVGARTKNTAGAYPELWQANKRMRRHLHLVGDIANIDPSYMITIDVDVVRAIKRRYVALKPTTAASVVDTRDFFTRAMQNVYRAVHYSQEERARFIAEAVSELMRKTRLPKKATLNAIMNAVLLRVAAPLETRIARGAAKVTDRDSPRRVWEAGKAMRFNRFDENSWDKDKRRAARIVRRAARRLA